MAKLVCIRHGQSLWNKENRFTGWVNVDLSDQGVQEATEAGRKLKSLELTFDTAHTSLLLRAQRTCSILLEELNQENINVKKSWRLNERHYGGLQGKNKKETAEIHGEDQVKIWRRSYTTRPPEMEGEFGHDLKSDHEEVPNIMGESLKDTVDRVIPYWNEEILSDLRKDQNVLVAAHGNSLRALLKHLYKILDEEIVSLELPTGRPIICHLNENFEGTNFEIL